MYHRNGCSISPPHTHTHIFPSSPSLLQLPQAGLEPWAMRGDCSRWLQHHGEDSTSPSTHRAHSIPWHLGLLLILLSHAWVTEGPTEVLW